MVPSKLALDLIAGILANAATYGQHVWSVGLMRIPFNEGDDLNDVAFVDGEPDGTGYAQLENPTPAVVVTTDPITGDDQLIIPPVAGGWSWTDLLTTYPGTIYGWFAYPQNGGTVGIGGSTAFHAKLFPAPIQLTADTDQVQVDKVSLEFNQLSFR